MTMMITDFLISLYPWTKALHIVSVISWMAGIFYLPRLFVYHVEKSAEIEGSGPLFELMEHRLLRMIMNPAMTATWVFGLMLVFTPGLIDWSMIWPWTKALGILAMTWFHHWLALRRKDFAKGTNTLSGRQYRIMNEVPTVLLLVIVFSVILRF
jgi:protoporphyrinogen IX oxidase